MHPYSESKGHATVDGKWLLTHAIWHPTTLAGIGNCPETGVRFLGSFESDERPRFELIQHGWHDFEAAEAIIVRGLRKHWSTDRIADLMQKLVDRRRRERGHRHAS